MFLKNVFLKYGARRLFLVLRFLVMLTIKIMQEFVLVATS